MTTLLLMKKCYFFTLQPLFWLQFPPLHKKANEVLQRWHVLVLYRIMFKLILSFLTVNICSEDGRICPDSFQPAQMFAYDIMERM